ncbi:MAG: hypothetical protein ACR2J9_06675, partial [Gaiellales bacterium]
MHLSHASTQDVETTSGSPLAQRRRAWSTSVIVLVIVGLIGLAAAQAQADPLWREATPAVFAAGVQHAPTAEAHFADVSCASAGNCTAVGDFINAGGYQEAFAQMQTHGEWGVASRNLVADPYLYRSRLTHISCSSA